MVAEKSEPTVSELLGTLAQSTATLVRQEVQLVSSEMGQKVATGSRAIAAIVAGGGVLLVGLLVLTFGLVAGLAAWVPVWISATAVGVAFAAIGATLMSRGSAAIRQLDLVPRQTVKTIKDDGTWVKEQVR